MCHDGNASSSRAGAKLTSSSSIELDQTVCGPASGNDSTPPVSRATMRRDVNNTNVVAVSMPLSQRRTRKVVESSSEESENNKAGRQVTRTSEPVTASRSGPDCRSESNNGFHRSPKEASESSSDESSGAEEEVAVMSEKSQASSYNEKENACGREEEHLQDQELLQAHGAVPTNMSSESRLTGSNIQSSSLPVDSKPADQKFSLFSSDDSRSPQSSVMSSISPPENDTKPEASDSDVRTPEVYHRGPVTYERGLLSPKAVPKTARTGFQVPVYPALGPRDTQRRIHLLESEEEGYHPSQSYSNRIFPSNTRPPYNRNSPCPSPTELFVHESARPAQAPSSDSEAERRTTSKRFSVDLLSLIKSRKIQSQQNELDFEPSSPPAASDVDNVPESTYAHALDGYLRSEEKLILHASKEFYLPLDMRGKTDTQATAPPYPTTSGFMWWPNSRRYFRPVLRSDSLLPRHRFLLGPTVYAQLYEYQRHAVAWMFELFKQRRGGVLADEMGLGKTVQTAAFLRGLFSSHLATHVLIIMPLTLIEQWRSHLLRWCPGCDIVVYHGSRSERKTALQTCTVTDGAVVLLTTYETFRNSCAELTFAHTRTCGPVGEVVGEEVPSRWKQLIDDEAEAWNRMGNRRPWDAVILDEAHKIKNARNQSAQAIRLVQAHCRVLLTGTPLTNKLDDLWSLMDFAYPGLLGNHLTFKNYSFHISINREGDNAEFADPIKAGSARNAAQILVDRKNQISLDLQQLILPYFLRRTVKVDGRFRVDLRVSMQTTLTGQPKEVDTTTTDTVAVQASSASNLLKKTDIVVWVELSPRQEQVSDTAPDTSTADAVSVPREMNDQMRPNLQVWRDRDSSLEQPGTCCPKDGSDIVTPWMECALNINQHDLDDLRQDSGKLLFLFSLLPSLQKKGHRCLLFSQSTKMLDLIEATVMRALGLVYLRIDGSVPNVVRQSRLKHFQQRANVFAMLMTTKVGGQGLNLTCADRVIIVDPDWTPANDNQAVARVHRLGQQKEVVVYRLFTPGAIEDHAFRLQTFKQGLTKVALEKANQKMYFSEEDMQKIFTLRAERGIYETLNILDSVDPSQQCRKQDIENAVRNDIGCMEFDNLHGTVIVGLSDFDELHHELSSEGSQAIRGSQAALLNVNSSVHKLKSEKYDETQLWDMSFIQKAKGMLKKKGTSW